MDMDEYVNFPLAKKNMLIPQRVSRTSQPDTPRIAATPKKTRLKQVRLKETTSAMMDVIRKIRVERLHEYFEHMCDRKPHELAIICGPSHLTYQELDYRANQLAHYLIARGVEEGDLVGILLERSLDSYIALLGILKAGAAFVPLDPTFPSDQITFIAQDAGLRDIVTTGFFHKKTHTLLCPVLELDQSHEILSMQHETRPQIKVDPASLCAIIYILDVTDQSQGVVISHANIVNFLRAATPIYGVKRSDRVYQGMPLASDLSFAEIWPTWIVGATLIADPSDTQSLGHQLSDFLSQHKITIFHCMPTQLATIEGDIPSLHTLLVNGTICPADLIYQWSSPGRRLLTTYGPIETTVTATWCELFPNRPATLGNPLPTYAIYILDEQLLPVTEGMSGEICIGGPGVTNGYHKRPELTQERFIPNPVARDCDMVPRLYRTGDIGRIRPSGEIEYLGQIDIQPQTHDYHTDPILHAAMVVADPVVKLFETQTAPKLLEETHGPKIREQRNLKNIYKHIITDPLYRNSLFNMASTFILGGLGFVFWIIVARLYKTENVGIATTLISIMTLLSDLTVMGLNAGLNRYLPKSTHKNELINSSFIIVTFVTLLTSIIFLLGLQVFSPPLLFLRSNLFYIISFTLFLLFFAWNILIESIFMAFRAASNILMKNSATSILKLLLPFAFITFGAYGIFASTASAFALGVFISLGVLILKFKIKPSISLNVSLIKETSVYSFANYMAGFMFAMPSLVLPVIILNTLSARYAAYYYVASMIQNILLIIPSAAAQALLTEGSYNEAEIKKHVKKAIAMILFILTPATAIIVFSGNILLQAFGKTYASEAFEFLQLYSASTIFTSLLLLSNAIMNVKHQIKYLIVSNVITAILTLFLSYTFISGKLVGIGWGWMLGQAIAGLISVFFIIRNIFYDRIS